MINPVNNSISAPLALPGFKTAPGASVRSTQPALPAVPDTLLKPDKVDSAPGAATFEDLLLDAIRKADSAEKAGDRTSETIRTGKEAGPAEALDAVREANDALRLMIEIQDRMIRAYQEVQNIRV